MQQDLDARLDRLEEGLDLVVSEIPRATAPRVEGWSDERLLKMRDDHRFSKSCRNRDFLKRILTRFYNLYFYGNVNEKDNVAGIVVEASSLARSSVAQLWPDSLFSDKPFYRPPASTEAALPVQDVGALPELVYIIPGISETAKKEYAALTTVYTVDKAKEFRALVVKEIDEIISSEGASDSELQLVQLTGFLALTLWRASTKNKDQLSNAFLKNQYKTNLISLAGWEANRPFCPPCTSCITLVAGALQKGLPTTSAMFVLLASEYVIARTAKEPDNIAAGILSATVLTHTARNGLGMIQLLEHASIATRQKWTELCKLSYLNITADSWDLIKGFFKSYLLRDQLQYGYNWARIINDGFLRDFAPREMLSLAGILAGIIEQHQGEGIWGAEWAKGYVEQLAEMRAYGKTVFEMTKPTLQTITAAGLSREVLSRAKLLVSSATPQRNDAAIIGALEL